MRFENGGQLTKHIREAHRKPSVFYTKRFVSHTKELRVFECYVCKEVMESLPSVRKHLKEHDKLRNRKCSICDLRMTANEEEHHLCRPENKIINCDYCPEAFKSIVDLLEHINVEHTNRKFYKCSICPLLFPMQTLSNYHSTVHGEVKHSQIRQKCQICQRVFYDEKKFKVHQSRHNAKRGKPR